MEIVLIYTYIFNSGKFYLSKRDPLKVSQVLNRRNEGGREKKDSKVNSRSPKVSKHTVVFPPEFRTRRQRYSRRRDRDMVDQKPLSVVRKGRRRF